MTYFLMNCNSASLSLVSQDCGGVAASENLQSLNVIPEISRYDLKEVGERLLQS